MGGTFSVHFGYSEGHVTRFASALAFARKGQAKVISVARAVLATVEHFLVGHDVGSGGERVGSTYYVRVLVTKED